MLDRVWQKGNLLTLLVGMQASTATMENRFNAWDRVLRAGALGWPWGMWLGGREVGGVFRMRNTCTPMADLCQIRSDQISHSVVSDSLRPHESQHARPPCPSPTPRVHWDSRPSSQWCHPTISSSVVPFSSCPQSLPASKSFPMSGQSTGVSA